MNRTSRENDGALSGWHDRFPQAVLGVGGPQHQRSNPLWHKGLG
jgi:hypothetical protein